MLISITNLMHVKTKLTSRIRMVMFWGGLMKRGALSLKSVTQMFRLPTTEFGGVPRSWTFIVYKIQFFLGHIKKHSVGEKVKPWYLKFKIKTNKYKLRYFINKFQLLSLLVMIYYPEILYLLKYEIHSQP